MKHILIGVLICCSFQISAYTAPDIPRVPDNLEIAGIKLKLTPEAKTIIQEHVFALRSSEKYFQIKLDRVNLYFPIIEKVLKEEGVPEDLKYIAVQESSLVSDAVSSADAVGYWQFKDFTAREVGLRVDNKVDERKNIVASTHGAAQYFKRNNFFFKNWIYSVSAYQAGPGGAKRYVDEKNYGSDKLTITKNTHWYVLKFIAHYVAFNGETGDSHSSGLRLIEYSKGAGMSLEEIAAKHGVDQELVREYNKWLRHGKVPDDKEYIVIIPTVGKEPKVRPVKEEDKEPPPLSRAIADPEPVSEKFPDQLTEGLSRKTIFIKINGIEAVMAGTTDNLVSIGLKSGIGINRLMKFNDIGANHIAEPGEIFYTQSKKNKSTIRFHLAEAGESMWKISQKYGIKLSKLAKKNHMDINEKVKEGRLMWLYKTRPKNTPVEYHKKLIRKNSALLVANNLAPPKLVPQKVVPKPTKVISYKSEEENRQTEADEKPKDISDRKNSKEIHIVEEGETLWSIAQTYQTTVENLQQINELPLDQALSIGQPLIVTDMEPAESTKDRDPVISEEFHVVKSGESLWKIAQKYQVSVEDLRRFNQLDENGSIHHGQRLQLSNNSKEAIMKESNFKMYEVKSGDSLYGIAQKHNMTVDELMKLNEMESTVLSIGVRLKVQKK